MTPRSVPLTRRLSVGLLPKVSASQTYAGIAMQCGDGSSELIFLDNNNAIEQSFGGGETYYEHYRK